MSIKNNSFIKLLRIYIRRFYKHDILGLSAEMSFYLFTALFPFVILVFVIATLISSSMQDMLLSLITYLPRDMELLITELLMSFKGSLPLITTSAVLGLWYMSNVISTLTKAMNRFYAVKETRGFFKLRFMFMIFAVFIIVIIFLSFALVIFGNGTQALLKRIDFLEIIDAKKIWNFLRYFSCILAIFLSMTFIFKQLPNKKIPLKNVVFGSALTTAAWCVTSYGFSFYVNYFASYHVIYGSLASIVILVAWVYLSAMVILLGASLNAFWYRIHMVKKYKLPSSNE